MKAAHSGFGVLLPVPVEAPLERNQKFTLETVGSTLKARVTIVARAGDALQRDLAGLDGENQNQDVGLPNRAGLQRKRGGSLIGHDEADEERRRHSDRTTMKTAQSESIELKTPEGRRSAINALALAPATRNTLAESGSGDEGGNPRGVAISKRETSAPDSRAAATYGSPQGLAPASVKVWSHRDTGAPMSRVQERRPVLPELSSAHPEILGAENLARKKMITSAGQEGAGSLQLGMDVHAQAPAIGKALTAASGSEIRDVRGRWSMAERGRRLACTCGRARARTETNASGKMRGQVFTPGVVQVCVRPKREELEHRKNARQGRCGERTL
ncbi:hypothetical protein C8F04DRAFT_1322187 [Mycena alexandri]|uniref:Uncharacterized protein n=1 Tax=Mycena alexandri TaxID=1745969 RepID=A0AAD6S169_9AGAR|nr:hypothetical protein C8F04DRAFT_1322187 [Mycena alexandri]